MKKSKYILSLITMSVFGILCGCTPKATSVWCSGLGENSVFSFDYAVIDSAFDGWTRTFSVKNTEDFEAFLIGLDDYVGTIQKADSSDSAFIFSSNGQKYYCAASDDGYKLSACAFIVYEGETAYYFPFPPAALSYKLSYKESNDILIGTIQPWDYFVAFYQGYSDVTITRDDMQIITDLYFGSGDIAGKVVLTYVDGNIRYELNMEI